MILILLMAVFHFNTVFGISKNYEEYLNKDFEIAECELINLKNKKDFTHREKRNSQSIHETNMEVRIKSLNRTFNMLLYEDNSFQRIPIQTYESGVFNTDYNNSTQFYEGVLKHGPLSSFAMGLFQNERFFGNVFDGKEMFYIQPIENFIPDVNDSKKVILYKNLNFIPFLWNISTNISSNTPPWRISFRTANFPGNGAKLINRRIKVSNRSHDLFCELEVVSDHALYNYFKKDVNRLSAYLYYHGKYADKIFRKVDFSSNGKPTGIRIAIKKISIYKTEYDENYPMINAKNVTDYLMRLIFRQQKEQFCLSMSFSYLNFNGFVIGEAFKPEIGPFGVFGGICDDPVLMPNEKPVHFNVGVINLYMGDNQLLPLSISLLAFSHELGHSFGSDHDNPNSYSCSLDEYLMSAQAVPSSKYYNEFSPCSRMEIWEVIQTKGGCLKDRKSVCGNLVREGNEECDCGWKSICDFVDSCCTPSDIELPETGCRLKAGLDIKCSPKESDCCLEDCTIVKNKSIPCYRDPLNCLESFCDGVNPICPLPNKNEFSHSCSINKLSCSGMNCNNSVCSTHGYTDCSCAGDIAKKCIVCCKSKEACLPASQLGILSPSGKEYYHRPGFKCYNQSFQCDKLGECVNLGDTSNTYIVLFSSLFAVFIFLLILLSVVIITARRRVNLSATRLIN